MSKLDGYSDADKQRIKSLMCELVEGQIESGEIEASDEAIRAAMPLAFSDAKAALDAANEYLFG